MSQVREVRHALVDHSLTMLRDKHTVLEDFRKHASLVSKILFLEATKHLGTRLKDIETPLTFCEGSELSEKVIVIPVLRAGLAMLFALQDILPTITVGLIGLERDEKTAVAREYYRKFPRIGKDDKVLILDPMLATGGSMDDVLVVLKDNGIEKVSLLSIVAAPEGIQRITQQYPSVVLYTTAIDKELNAQKYIVPGLGDFGDRYFGTEA